MENIKQFDVNDFFSIAQTIKKNESTKNIQDFLIKLFEYIDQLCLVKLQPKLINQISFQLRRINKVLKGYIQIKEIDNLLSTFFVSKINTLNISKFPDQVILFLFLIIRNLSFSDNSSQVLKNNELNITFSGKFNDYWVEITKVINDIFHNPFYKERINNTRINSLLQYIQVLKDTNNEFKISPEIANVFQTITPEEAHSKLLPTFELIIKKSTKNLSKITETLKILPEIIKLELSSNLVDLIVPEIFSISPYDNIEEFLFELVKNFKEIDLCNILQLFSKFLKDKNFQVVLFIAKTLSSIASKLNRNYKNALNLIYSDLINTTIHYESQEEILSLLSNEIIKVHEFTSGGFNANVISFCKLTYSIKNKQLLGSLSSILASFKDDPEFIPNFNFWKNVISNTNMNLIPNTKLSLSTIVLYIASYLKEASKSEITLVFDNDLMRFILSQSSHINNRNNIFQMPVSDACLHIDALNLICSNIHLAKGQFDLNTVFIVASNVFFTYLRTNNPIIFPKVKKIIINLFNDKHPYASIISLSLEKTLMAFIKSNDKNNLHSSYLAFRICAKNLLKLSTIIGNPKTIFMAILIWCYQTQVFNIDYDSYALLKPLKQVETKERLSNLSSQFLCYITDFIFSQYGLASSDSPVVSYSLIKFISMINKSHELIPEFAKRLEINKWYYINETISQFNKMKGGISIYSLQSSFSFIEQSTKKINEFHFHPSEYDEFLKYQIILEKPQKIAKEIQKQDTKMKKNMDEKIPSTLNKSEKIEQLFNYIALFFESNKIILKNTFLNMIKCLKIIMKNNNNQKEIIDIANKSNLIDVITSFLGEEDFKFESLLTIKFLFKNLHFPYSNLGEPISEGILAIKNNILTKKYLKEISKVADLISTYIEKDPLPSMIYRTYIKLIEHAFSNVPSTSSQKQILLISMGKIIDTIKPNPLDLVKLCVLILNNTYISEYINEIISYVLSSANSDYIYDLIYYYYKFDVNHQIFTLKLLNETSQISIKDHHWYSSFIWSNVFNENKEISNLACKLANKYNISLYNSMILSVGKHNIINYLESTSQDIRENAIKTIITFCHMCPHWTETIMKTILNLMEKPILYTTKVAFSNIIKGISYLIPEQIFESLFIFLFKKGCVDSNPTVSKSFIDCGITFVNDKGETSSELLASVIYSIIDNLKDSISDLGKSVAMLLLGNLAKYLKPDNPKLNSIFTKLLTLFDETESISILESLAKCIKNFTTFFEQRSNEILNRCIEMMKGTTNSKGKHRQVAFLMAGLVKGLGMKTLHKYLIYEHITECLKDKQDTQQKECSLYCITAIRKVLGKSSEIYAIEIFPLLLSTFASSSDNIRNASMICSESIMNGLSKLGVKNILPLLLNGIRHSNWRTKVASIEALGSVAYMAPKQLSQSMPNIITELKEVLNEIHSKVHDSAIETIKRIGSVIRNPEIAEISSELILALKDPSVHLLPSINLLLRQSFYHAIDAPSLSIIIPIIDYGLKANNNNIKKLTTQLVGSISKLTSSGKDLLPYIQILLPSLMRVLYDSIPELRTSAAQALAALTVAISLQESSEIIKNLKTVIGSDRPSCERSGSTQGYAEIIAAQGIQYFETELHFIFKQSRDPDPRIREGFIGVFLFLPVCYSDVFLSSFTVILPTLLEGLSDSDENVRGVANRSVQICISQFGRSKCSLLVSPLINLVFDERWKIRECSLQLLGKLLQVIENDMVREIPKYITQEERTNILLSIYILKFDQVENLSNTASGLWKSYVDNVYKVIKAIYEPLINKVIFLLSSKYEDIQQTGRGVLKDLILKYSDRLLNTILNFFKSKLLNEDCSVMEANACLIAIIEITSIMDKQYLNDFRNYFLNVLIDYGISEEPSITNSVAKIVLNLCQKDPSSKEFVITFFKKISALTNTAKTQADFESISNMQATFRAILKAKPNLTMDLINILTDGGLNSLKIECLTSIISFICQEIFTNLRYLKITNSILELMSKENIDEVTFGSALKFINTLSDFISRDEIERYANIINDKVVDSNVYNKNARAFLLITEYLFRSSKSVYVPFAQMFLENTLRVIEFGLIQHSANMPKTLTSLINSIPEVEGYQAITKIKASCEIIEKKDSGIFIKFFRIGEFVEQILPIVLNAFANAAEPLRIISAIFLQDFLKNTNLDLIKPHLNKIVGKLIRVVNDKFSMKFKYEILKCVLLLFENFANFVKHFSPQIQTTGIKIFNDLDISLEVIEINGKIIEILPELTMRPDSIIIDLIKNIGIKNKFINKLFELLVSIYLKHNKLIKAEQLANIFNSAVKQFAMINSDAEAAQNSDYFILFIAILGSLLKEPDIKKLLLQFEASKKSFLLRLFMINFLKEEMLPLLQEQLIAEMKKLLGSSYQEIIEGFTILVKEKAKLFPLMNSEGLKLICSIVDASQVGEPIMKDINTLIENKAKK